MDYRKSLKHLYLPSAKEPEMIDVPSINFIKISGHGNPNTSAAYQAAVNALYSLAYTIKFTLKKSGRLDFSVFPLEGLWWAEDMSAFTLENKDSWSWTMMIAQPDEVDQALFTLTLEETRRKKPSKELEQIRFEAYEEGLSAQILHIGPYAAEAPTIERLHTFIHDRGYILAGLHHEIYLGDPRRSEPEKLRTVIRQPAKPA